MRFVRYALLGAGVLVGCLTLLNYHADSQLLFDLLFPGLVAGLLITGGHGGTVLEEHVALVVGLLINVMVYASTLLLIAKAWGLRRERPW